MTSLVVTPWEGENGAGIKSVKGRYMAEHPTKHRIEDGYSLNTSVS